MKKSSSSLREQSVGQNVLRLLFVLSHLFFQSLEFRSQKVCRTAGDNFCIADALLLYFFVEGFYGLSVLTTENSAFVSLVTIL